MIDLAWWQYLLIAWPFAAVLGAWCFSSIVAGGCPWRGG